MSDLKPTAPLNDPTPDSAAEAPEKEPFLGLSLPQVIGSALTAITVAFLASRLGTTGTLVGAGLMSVIATVSTATYTKSLKHSSEWLKKTSTGILPGAPGSEKQSRLDTIKEKFSSLNFKRVALGVGVVLLVTMGTLTAIEYVAGKPVSSITGGSKSDDTGTTLGRVSKPKPAKDKPKPEKQDDKSTQAPSPSEAPTPDSEPTPSESAIPSEEPTPVETPAPEPTTEVPAPVEPAPAESAPVQP